MLSFNSIIEKLNIFWKKNGCIILQPFDSEMGAATFHSCTFINAIRSSNYRAAYTQFTRRPFDFKYNTSSNKSVIFHQYQVIIKPSIDNIQELYLKSLKNIGININKNDIRFIEDNWASPTLGAAGIGWEVRLNGIEITQITYFQQMGGIQCIPIMVEIAYGLERLTLHVQNITNIDDIIIDKNAYAIIKYSDIFKKYEREYTKYLIAELDIPSLDKEFLYIENKIKILIEKSLSLIAYDYLVKLTHIFNLIDSKICYGFIRQGYISRVKDLANKIAQKIHHDE